MVVAGYRVGIGWTKNGHPRSMHKVTKFHAPDFHGGSLGHELCPYHGTMSVKIKDAPRDAKRLEDVTSFFLFCLTAGANAPTPWGDAPGG